MKKEEILANCIEEIRSGKSTVEDCTKRYPHLNKELQSLLEVALFLKPDEITPSSQFKERAKMHLFDEIQPVGASSSRNFWPWHMMAPAKVALASVLIGVFVLVIAGGSTVYAAQSSLPGDALYPVKQGVENFQLAITTNPTAKADLHLKFAQRRIDEVQQEVKLNRNISPQTLDNVTKQFDNALKELSNSGNTKANDKTLSRLSVATVDQQVELQQTLASAHPSSQPIIQQIIDETRRGNIIAQVAYANHDLLQNQLSVTDNKLDAGQFSIEGTLISIQDKTWNVGGTIIENVHLSGETPVIGSRIKLQGLVKDHKTFITKISIGDNSTEPTKVEGQFGGTNQNGTADISGLSVTLNNPGNPQLNPGDQVQLQSGNDNTKLDVTGLQYDGNHTASLIGTLLSVDTSKGTITVKITGSQISVNVGKAQISNKNDSHREYRLSDLKDSIGHDIKLDGLSKKGDLLYADTVWIETGK
jgi:hypothetical protein